MAWDSSRREFLKAAALTGMGAIAAESAGALLRGGKQDPVRFGCIGVGGKGRSDTEDAAECGKVVAICDVDENALAAALKVYPNARPFTDYRRMLETMGREIEAVTVSTPDHTHGPAAAMAMLMGKHCYCQKPLTHSIWEARRMGEIARKMGVQTQMGNQYTADPRMRRNAYAIRAGALGKVSEVHVWTNRPIWGQGGARPAAEEAPASLKWDLWLGPAAARPYAKAYHPFGWRGWWDFGTGALGDMACHTVNLPYMALDLRDPISVVAESSGNNRESYPSWSIITFEFPATKKRPAIRLRWYDGGKTPPAELLDGAKMEAGGSLIIGERGKLYTPGDYGTNGRWMGGIDPGNVTFPESPGHMEELVAAIRGGTAPVSNFPDYSGPLTETILLGNLAVWADGKKIEWDSRRMRARNAPEVMPIVHPKFRKGFEVP